MSGEVPRVIRCAIYTRKSREFLGDYGSCEAQFDACLYFVQALGRIGWHWNGVRYDDEGESSERLDRPGLMRLMADIAAGIIDRVVVYRLDRLARRLVHSATILKEFRDRNVGFTIVTSPELGCSAQDSLVLNILSSFGEFELELTRERLREAINHLWLAWLNLRVIWGQMDFQLRTTPCEPIAPQGSRSKPRNTTSAFFVSTRGIARVCKPHLATSVSLISKTETFASASLPLDRGASGQTHFLSPRFSLSHAKRDTISSRINAETQMLQIPAGYEPRDII